MRKLLRNANYLSPDMKILEGDIFIEEESILQILPKGEKPTHKPDIELNLEGHLVFPGLINAHDHLINSLPGPNFDRKFTSWHEWETELKSTSVFRRLQRLSAADLYTLGMYRNVISGVTLVVDHFPQQVRATFHQNPLVSLLEHFFLAHSVSNYRLEWGQGIQQEFSQSRGVLPFILHVCEGTTQELQEECESLNRLGALGENTLMVNPIGIPLAQIETVASRHASIVWCPSSCENIFGSHPPILAARQAGIRIAIGSDHALSNSGTLFDDLRLARRLSREQWGSTITDEDIVRMVTCCSAEILGISKELGSIAPGKIANLLVFPVSDKSPYDTFFDLSPSRISMLIHRGEMVLGDEEFRKASSFDLLQYTECLIEGQPKILMGRPLHLIERIENKLEESIKLPFLPIFAGP